MSIADKFKSRPRTHAHQSEVDAMLLTLAVFTAIACLLALVWLS